MYAKAAITLHNYMYLCSIEDFLYTSPGYIDGEDGEGNPSPGAWRADDESAGLQSVSRTGSNRYVSAEIIHTMYPG